MSDSWPDIVHDLLRPEAYGLASGEVTLRTTHASWVFLTDRDVWKLKRPVDLGFLDFRDVESRRRACEEEVRLNRRLAPDVYLGVEPVHRTARGHALSGGGPVVDWAVHMRRLPDTASAASLLEQGRLDARSLGTVAERLADFLREARPAPDFGKIATLGRNLDENFAQVAPFVGDLLDQKTFDDVQAFQREELTRNAARFVERVAENRVREGHGDLRLEHVYLLPTKEGPPQPVVIDCIEFAERFRCGDSAAELAFLSMELESAGRPDSAAGFLARFAEASDDFGLYGVLDFYLSYRAWVRGKVAAFVAVDPSTPSTLRASKREEARRLFGLARSFSGSPLDRPFLIAVGGLIRKRQEHPGRRARAGAGRPSGQLRSNSQAVGRPAPHHAGEGEPLWKERARADLRRGHSPRRPGRRVGSRCRSRRDVLDPPPAPACRGRRARRAGDVRLHGDALPA